MTDFIPCKSLKVILPSGQGLVHYHNNLKRIIVFPGRLAVVNMLRGENGIESTTLEISLGSSIIGWEYEPLVEDNKNSGL